MTPMVNGKEVAVGPPLWLLAEVTYACPLHCVFCYNPVDYTQHGPELTTQEWLKVLRDARAAGSVQCGFSGGEPLVRDDLEELVAEAHKLGFYTNLLTSGIGFTPERAKALKLAGLDHVQLSFQDSTRELNDFLSHTKTFALKQKAAQLIQDNQPSVWKLMLAQNLSVEVCAVSMGNPHAVMRVDDVDQAPVATQGPQIESHPAFAHRVNAGFMQIISRQRIKLRVFERGAGETLACGTGACAAVVAGIAQNWLDSVVQVQTRGGLLTIEWQGGRSPVWMSGPATTVFKGEIEIPV